MMDYIHKPSIFVTSTGRTGTQFFARLFGDVVPDCDALHEPGMPNFRKPDEILEAVRHFGWRHVFLDVFHPDRNVRGLSFLNNSGHIDDMRLREALYSCRAEFVSSLSGNRYVESNGALIGLINVLPTVFSHCRTILMIRDPRTWLASMYNSSYASVKYSRTDYPYRVFHSRITPGVCSDDPYQDKWADMDWFQRNCWYWRRHYSSAVRCVHQSGHARCFRFEDIFSGPERYQHLGKLVNFATEFLDTSVRPSSLRGVLDKKVNQTQSKKFPCWHDWPPERAQQCYQICGSLMTEFGYGDEDKWQGKLRKARADECPPSPTTPRCHSPS